MTRVKMTCSDVIGPRAGIQSKSQFIKILEELMDHRESIKIISPMQFVVDGFTVKNKELYKHWFLTHFHSDHYQGLTKGKWKHGIICIPINSLHRLFSSHQKYD
jgi:phosphoribosyl 1,2-cyclic phosphodiesterase